MKPTHSTSPVSYALRALAGIGLAITGMSSHAQVTLFGLVDESVARLNQGGTSKPVTAVASGIGAASRWGIRVEEDLGAGLQAVAVLEAGFDADAGLAMQYSGNPNTATPALPNGTSGTGFNRRSFVSLGSDAFGTVALGRDYAPVYYPALATDNLNLNYFNNI